MSERAPRLGDVVDDYCPRCRLLLNHDVAALLEGQVAKVTCRTCFNTHDYRHAQEPARRKPAARRPDKQALMEQVLAGLGQPEPLAEKDGVALAGEDLAGRLLSYLESEEPLLSCRHCLGSSGAREAHRQLPLRRPPAAAASPAV